MFELIARVFAPVRGVERVADVGARLCATCYRRLIVAIDPIDNFERSLRLLSKRMGTKGRSRLVATLTDRAGTAMPYSSVQLHRPTPTRRRLRAPKCA